MLRVLLGLVGSASVVVALSACDKQAGETPRAIDAAAEVAQKPATPWWRSDTPCPEGAELQSTEEGRRHQCIRKDGSAHGRMVTLNRELKKRTEGAFVNGKRDGIWSQWNDKGELLGTYSMNRGTGTLYEWFDNGDPRLEVVFKDGKRSGPYREWHEGRKLRWQRAYEAGLPVGGWQQWSRAGKLLGNLSFKNGSGRFIEWDEKGAEAVSGEFRKGKQHKTWKWKWVTDGKDGPVRIEYRRAYRDGKVLSLRIFRNGKEVRDGEEAKGIVALAPATKTKKGPAGVLGVLHGGPSAFGADDLSAFGALKGDGIGETYGAGGLGLRGSGPGGGGVGETGKLGVGSSDSGGRSKLTAKKKPTFRRGKLVVMGSLDREIIARVLRRATSRLRYCYTRALQKNPSLKGRVTVSFLIDQRGRVSSSTASGTVGDKSVERCFAGAIKSQIFPEPKGGGIVRVKAPFNLDTQ